MDNVFKSQVEQLKSDDLPGSWDKNNSWERLQHKRKRRNLAWYFSAAAILIIGLLLSSVLQNNTLSKDNISVSENVFVEYQNRQKLKEIEERMSGNYYSVKICLACDDIYYEVIKQDRPEKFTYYKTLLN